MKGSTLKFATEEVQWKKEKRQRGKETCYEEKVGTGQPSEAPTKEETETEETEALTWSFKHKATKHQSLRRADNALPISPCKKKENVTSLAI